jgi:uncharacterized oligopeptide transporter (OPT) family protein
VVAAGAAFVIPALYINELEPTWWEIFLACSVGGFLGIVLIIPLRKYFVKDLHGDLPFPEATAINEILVSGEGAGKGAGKILLMSIGLGAVYDFLVDTVHLWNAKMSTTALLGTWGAVQNIAPWAGGMPSKTPKAIGLSGMVIGLGAIVGCLVAPLIAAVLNRRIAYFLLCLGSFVACQVLFRYFNDYTNGFLLMAFIVGAVTAAFYGWLPLYLPELFPTRVRAT